MNPADLQKGDALLVVDIQNDFCPGGSQGIEAGDEVIPVLNRWIRRAHEMGIPTFLSRDWHPVNHISFKERGGPWVSHCVQNTRGAEFHPDLFVPKTAVLIHKANTPDNESYSAFGATPLARLLKEAAVSRLWIGGLALDYCVVESALDAIKQGLEVHVLIDATRAVNMKPGDDGLAIQRMQAAGVHIDRGE